MGKSEHERRVKEFLAAAEAEDPERYALLKHLYPVRPERSMALRRRRETRIPAEVDPDVGTVG
jgi:hypothetical protein